MKYQTTENMNLLTALEKLSPGSSKTTMRSWIKDGRVLVDGRVIKKTDHALVLGQVVSLGEKKRRAEGNLQLLYEDAHIVVVEKPIGMLSVATAFETEDTVHAHLKERYRPYKVFVVHRLDQDTSGVMLFARTEEAYIRLKETFEAHDIEREYEAIVEGVIEEGNGTWNSYLYEDPNYVVHSSQDPSCGGKYATTHYIVIGKTKHWTRLILNLETGRKNQIRVHCRDSGHPIVGDRKYGAKPSPLKRMCLHARLLVFNHPITQKKMHFSSPVPESFDKLVKAYA